MEGFPNHNPTSVRSPGLVRTEGNHLINQKSLYLQQHSHNPIDWFPWGEEALRRARDEDKPIFLSVGYSSCHWCHVMEKEVFEDDEVAEFMNQYFVCIKVDREERPDLDSAYMESVMAMSGRGGWPMSVFLTPELKPFFGATYLPREAFRQLAKYLQGRFLGQRDRIEDQAAAVYRAIAREPILAQEKMADQGTLEATIMAAREQFDAQWGGMKSTMKFPVPMLWTFLLHYYRRIGDQQIAQMVRLTLDQMGSGGIHDQVGGGFHRYSVEPSWLVPHFEKMLYDNALLACLYTESSVAFASQDYADIARNTLDFMVEELSGKEGAFYSSLDADSGGEEGSYYLWTQDEILSIAGADGLALCSLLSVSPEGNFEGKNIITRRTAFSSSGALHEKPMQDPRKLFERYRSALKNHRSKRTPPSLDEKIITAWNGLAIAAFSQGYRVFDDSRYLSAAIRAANFLWSHHMQADGTLARCSSHGEIGDQGILDDYAFLAWGLLELFQASGQVLHFQRALELSQKIRKFFRKSDGLFYLTSNSQEAPLGRKIELFDHAIPSGNSVLLQVWWQLALLTGELSFLTELKNSIHSVSPLMRTAGLQMAGWFDVWLKILESSRLVVVAGQPEDEKTQALLQAVSKILLPHIVLVQVPASGASAEMQQLAPVTRGKSGVQRPTAFVCDWDSCQKPTSDPQELVAQIQSRK